MHDKDIVYVSNSPYTDIQKVLGIIQTVSSPVISAVSVAATLR